MYRFCISSDCFQSASTKQECSSRETWYLEKEADTKQVINNL